MGALAASLLAVWLVGAVRERTTLRPDTSIGIVFTSMFAGGLVLISATPSASHLQEILFGNLLGISDAALVQAVGFGAAALLVMLACARAWTLWAFDASFAAAIGMRVWLVRGLLTVCMACVVVASVQAVGVILVVAMLITPGAVAYLLTRRFAVMLLVAPVVAWASAMVGIWVSFWADVSTGGTIVLVQACVFAVVYVAAPREGVLQLRSRSHASS